MNSMLQRRRKAVVETDEMDASFIGEARRETIQYRTAVYTSVVIVCLLICFVGTAVAIPTEPAPPGKVWVEVDGTWILVVAPPNSGPYIWKGGIWVIDPTPPPPQSAWVAGHWAGHRWVPGHWKKVDPPGPGLDWIAGRWDKGHWIAGHWKGHNPPGRQWVPPHRGPGGKRVPGHYK